MVSCAGRCVCSLECPAPLGALLVCLNRHLARPSPVLRKAVVFCSVVWEGGFGLYIMRDFYGDHMVVEQGDGGEELELEKVNSVFPSLGSSCSRVSPQGHLLGPVVFPRACQGAKGCVSACDTHIPHAPGREVSCERDAGQGAWGLLAGGLRVVRTLVAGTPLTHAFGGPPASVGGPFSLKEGSLTCSHRPFLPSLLPCLCLPGLQGQLSSESVPWEAQCW